MALAILLVAAPAIAQTAGPPMAKAQVKDTEGKLAGKVTFEQVPNGVLLRASLKNLPPGAHAIHIHETAQCEAPDFESAGGHYDPQDRQHGYKDPGGAHAGDLPNLHVPASRTVRVDVFTGRVSLASQPANILDQDGSAVVIHAKPDDYTTDPRATRAIASRAARSSP